MNIILTGILCALPASAGAWQKTQGAWLRAEHRMVVQAWLAHNKRLRLATEKDVMDRESLRRQRETSGQSYHPFYAVGDFNSDGQQDFAVTLVSSRRRAKVMALALFNGPFRAGKNSRPAFFEEGFEPSDWLFFRPDDRLLLVGPPESDNCFILKPRGRKYILEDCLS